MIIKLYEKYLNIKEVKAEIFIKAIDTNDKEIIEFFIKKGYDINGKGVLFASSFDEDIFRYFLEKGIKVENNDHDFDRRLTYLEIQKALIDYGYEVFINDTVGFNNSLKNDPKYADVVQRFEDIGKYNL